MNQIAIINTSLSSSFESYLQSIYRIPLLTAEEEISLAKKFFETQDKNAAQKLVFSHMKFVVKIAKNYQSTGLSLPDLVQEGALGLMKAVQKFNPYHGVRLASFAIHWIKSEIHEFILKNWSLVKIAKTKAQRKIFFNLHKFKKSGKYYTIEDIKQIAEFLDVSEKEVNHMVKRMSQNGDTYAEEHENQDLLFSDSNHECEIENENLECYRNACIGQALETLDTRSQKVIQERWLNTEDKTSLKELASRFGVSLVRISQIEKQALNKLRLALTDII